MGTAPLNTTGLKAIPLSCISVNTQPCKARPEIVTVNGDNPIFTLLVLKQVNAVAIGIILMIPTQKYVFLMLQKI